MAGLFRGQNFNVLLQPRAADTNDPLTYRSAMLPLGLYDHGDGTEHLGLAWPGMISEPVAAANRLFGHGGWAQGPDAGSNAEDMNTLLLSRGLST